MGSAWLWARILRRRNRPIVRQHQDLRSALPMRVKYLSSRRRPRTPVEAVTVWDIYSHRCLLDMLVTNVATLKSNIIPYADLLSHCWYINLDFCVMKAMLVRREAIRTKSSKQVRWFGTLFAKKPRFDPLSFSSQKSHSGSPKIGWYFVVVWSSIPV
jgi:hypothetical protein